MFLKFIPSVLNGGCLACCRQKGCFYMPTGVFGQQRHIMAFLSLPSFFLDVFTDVRFSEPQAFQSDAGLRGHKENLVFTLAEICLHIWERSKMGEQSLSRNSEVDDRLCHSRAGDFSAMGPGAASLVLLIGFWPGNLESVYLVFVHNLPIKIID